MVSQAKLPARDALTPIIYHIISCVFRIYCLFIQLASILLYRPCHILYRPHHILYRPHHIPRFPFDIVARSSDNIFRRFRIVANRLIGIDVSVFLERIQDVRFHGRGKIPLVSIIKTSIISDGGQIKLNFSKVVVHQRPAIKILSGIRQQIEPDIDTVIIFGQQVVDGEFAQKGIENDCVSPGQDNAVAFDSDILMTDLEKSAVIIHAVGVLFGASGFQPNRKSQFEFHPGL